MFDYTAALERLLRHVVDNCSEFSSVRPDQVLVSYTQTRTPTEHGVYASVHPLRFEGGETTRTVRNRSYVMPRLVLNGTEMLYVMYFALPRFLDLDFERKLTTVFHELYHISPEFNGDIRRFPGKNFAHGHSRKRYNELMGAMAKEYLLRPGSGEHTSFLHLSFSDLQKEHGDIVGRKVRPPKPVPVK